MGWDLPPPGWCKINLDGAFKSGSSVASAGGLLCNENGRWISGFAINLGSCLAMVAEIWGVWHALNLVWS